MVRLVKLSFVTLKCSGSSLFGPGRFSAKTIGAIANRSWPISAPKFASTRYVLANRILRDLGIYILGKRFIIGAAILVGTLIAPPQNINLLFGNIKIAGEARAQNIGADLLGQRTDQPAQMLLEADQLEYNDAEQSVTAVGNVQIAYDGYSLVASQVTYHHGTGRVIAQGNVVIVEPNGNRIFAEEIDITDNFSDGFVSALQVETAENTRFAADSAERISGNLTILKNGVYTACEACKENPSKPPLWQIRAQKVIIDKDAGEVSYEKASFELFGKPIAYLRYFSHADPSIKRKSGFLIPSIMHSEHLGYGVTTSYFFNLAPNYDLTLATSYYSNQGFLGSAEWRHRTQSGTYNLTIAGINQQESEAFDPGTYDSTNDKRHALQTSGRYEINSKWVFGWQYLLQSDRNFARTYKVTSQTQREVTNNIFLTGLNDTNYFDIRAQRILLQQSNILNTRQELQAKLSPIIDHNYIFDGPVAGGQLSYNFNLINVDREGHDIANSDRLPSLAQDERHYGIAGEHTRASADVEWKANIVTNSGLMITPSLHGQVDGLWSDTDDLNTQFNPLMSNDSLYRAMPTAGLEIRYPLIANSGIASHIIEPIAQVFASTDETHIGEFPNEDAQSTVFDTTNLFSRNKFSGYDRLEGGIRANVGFRYAASFNSGNSIDVMAGQSFHLGGQNSFATRDVVNAGIESGLETKVSDYVASAQFNSTSGFSLRTAGRFDEKTFEIRHGEVGAAYRSEDLSASVRYGFSQAQPNYGFKTDRHEIATSGSVKFLEYWRAFGGITYDLETSSIVSDSIGIAYDDSCFSFSVAYKENRSRFTGDQVNQSINFKLGFRTIGNYAYRHELEDDTQ